MAFYGNMDSTAETARQSREGRTPQQLWDLRASMHFAGDWVWVDESSQYHPTVQTVPKNTNWADPIAAAAGWRQWLTNGIIYFLWHQDPSRIREALEIGGDPQQLRAWIASVQDELHLV